MSPTEGEKGTATMGGSTSGKAEEMRGSTSGEAEEMRVALMSFSCAQRKRVSGDTGGSTSVHLPTPKSPSSYKKCEECEGKRGKGTTCTAKGAFGASLSRF